MKSALNIKALTKLTYKKMILHKITITECTSKDNINMRFSGPSSRRRASALFECESIFEPEQKYLVTHTKLNPATTVSPSTVSSTHCHRLQPELLTM